MITNIEYYINKLSVLKDYINQKIDGYEVSLEDLYCSYDMMFELSNINKSNEENKSQLIYITDHAYIRAKERLSMNGSSFLKLAEKAYLNGMKHKDSFGNLKKYIDATFLDYRNANNIRIYGEVFFLFNFNKLITVYQIPTNLRKTALKIQKQLCNSKNQ